MPDLPSDLTFSDLFGPKPDHPYFEYSQAYPFQPDASGFSRVNALWLAECSLLVYVPDAALVNEKLSAAGFTYTHCLNFDDMDGPQCFVAHDGKEQAIVSFRGTELTQFADLLADLAFWPKPEPTNYGDVHGGFLTYLDILWDDIREVLDPFRRAAPDATIWFTGHSLGAAMATLGAVRQSGPRSAYTFGSPRVGGREFHDKLNLERSALPIFRYVNDRDVVTTVPPFPARHVGHIRYITSGGEIEAGYDRWTAAKEYLARKARSFYEAVSKEKDLRRLVKGLTRCPEFLSDHSPSHYVHWVRKDLA